MHDPLQPKGSRRGRTTVRAAPSMTFSTSRLKLAAACLLLAVAAVSVALLTRGTAHAQTLAGQQATAAQLRAAVRAESRKISATAAGIAEAQGRVAVLDARVQKRQQQAQDTQDRLIAARVRLTRLQRNAASYQKTLAANLVAAYKTPAPDLLGVAVEAKGFDDLLSQLQFLRDISKRNATILRDTRHARQAVATQTADLAKLRLKLIGLAKQASDDRDQANVIRNALLRRQAAQLARRSGAQSRLATVRARIASLERQQAADALRNSAPPGATDQAPPAPAPGGPPAQGDDAVAQVVAAANQIATTPYVWGGGHGGSASGGYDCSGSLSYALAAAGLVNGSLTSGGFMSWGDPGPGRRITVYANGGHAFMIVDGRRYDTSALSGGGTRWTTAMRSTAGFVARHPPGL
jgi:peptidoglycan hydrolase CwlO-like protein